MPLYQLPISQMLTDFLAKCEGTDKERQYRNAPKHTLFSVTCVIMQKNGAGLHTASSCYWDNSTDGSCTVRWENKTMYCIVSVFGLAI
jgi:hypothetical protein